MAFGGGSCNSSSEVVVLPDPVVDNPLAAAKGRETAVVAGGCFWESGGVRAAEGRAARDFGLFRAARRIPPRMKKFVRVAPGTPNPLK